MKFEQQIYEILSNQNQRVFDQIEKHELLGAGNHLTAIGEMLIDIANQSVERDLPVDTAVNYVLELADHCIQSRGAASRAVYNGIREMIISINYSGIPTTAVLKRVVDNNVEEFRKNAAVNLDKIIAYAKNELSMYQNILLFDYSSTVEKSILALAESGNRLSLYIAESAAIDGGRPFFNLIEKSNITIHFFPDAALYHQLQKCDCVLMGAETFYAGGTGFNTIGSDLVGVLCEYLNKPLYFITPLNKLDSRRVEGIRKEIVYIDYKRKYKNASQLNDSFDTTVPELIGVEPKHIYAFVTEEGVIPSGQMFSISMKYNEKLGGK